MFSVAHQTAFYIVLCPCTYVLIFMHACSLLSSQELEPPVATLKDNLQKLEAGQYWDMDKIKPK